MSGSLANQRTIIKKNRNPQNNGQKKSHSRDISKGNHMKKQNKIKNYRNSNEINNEILLYAYWQKSQSRLLLGDFGVKGIREPCGLLVGGWNSEHSVSAQSNLVQSPSKPAVSPLGVSLPEKSLHLTVSGIIR